MVALLESVKDRWAKRAPDVEADSIGLRWCPFGEKRIVEAKANDPAQIVAIVNTAALDMDEEIVVPSGLDPAYFNRFKAVYWNHDYFGTPPVATMRSVELTGDGWRMRAAMSSLPFARDVLTLIREEAVNGTSIGFAATEAGPATAEESAKYGPAGRVIRKAIWLETSITPMPCNPDAVITAKAETFDPSPGTVDAVDRLMRKGRIGRDTAARFGVQDAVPPRRRMVLL